MSGAVWSLVLLTCPGWGGEGYEYVSDGPPVTESVVGGDEGAPVGEYGRMGLWRTYWGPEPQTCYSPRFGCYPGNQRHLHRHSAFHGYYYRRPYNYRLAFDYPWHAGLHEPTSHFSYNVEPPAGEEVPLPEAQGMPPLPHPPADASGSFRPASKVRPVTHRPSTSRASSPRTSSRR